MYQMSKSCVRIKSEITGFFPIHLGVKQGDNLSPNFFKIFINDLPKYLQDTADPVFVNKRPLHCLMYADDVILLSTSAAGLQQKLDKLGIYCNDWCLKINTSKTKVLIFNKAGRHLKQGFNFKNVQLDCVSHYKYLGLFFSASGSFSFAQKELFQKAQKAYFKLCKDFLSLNPNINISMHVFDHTIKPILLYGSEIWAYFDPFKSKLKNGAFTFDQIYGKLFCEKLHTRFCKFILGLHRKTTNIAVMSELGRFPLHFNIIRSMIKYWYRLENLGSSFPLLKDAYLSSKELHAKKISSWYGSVQTLFTKLHGIKDLHNASPYTFSRLSNKHMKTHYYNEWRQLMNKYSDGKLCTYSTFKDNFGFEQYLLLLKNFEQRRNLSRFRVSAHKLRIETARYQGTLRQDRTCLRCNSGEIEDEKHFLFTCSKLSAERDILLQQILTTCKNFNTLTINQKMIWLMTTENVQILSCLSNYISKHGV